MPNIQLSALAIALTVFATFIVGFLWYTPLFGKRWAKEMGYVQDMKAPASELIKGMAFMLIGNFLMAFVFSHNIAAWDPISWGLPPSPMPKGFSAFMAALFTWLGFYLPGDLGSTVWEKRSWILFFINTSYHFVNLLVAAMILVFVG